MKQSDTTNSGFGTVSANRMLVVARRSSDFGNRLPLRRKVNGPEHPRTLGATTNLAISYRHAGRIPEAIELQEKALEIKRHVLPKTHPYLAAAIINLASYYDAAGRIDEAETLRKELASLKTKAPNPAEAK